MNNYQEALIYFCNGCHHEYEEGEYGQCKRVEGRCKHYKVLQELVNKEIARKRIYVEETLAISSHYICPVCKRKVSSISCYCDSCGQRLN